MRFAYADPPYPGQAARHYGEEAAADGRVAREVNHPLLIAHLCEEFPDGWALSTSSPALRSILGACPDDVRVGVWVKPFAVYKPGVNPAYSWEPVIFRGGRKIASDVPKVRDYVSEPIRLRRGRKVVIGQKPRVFCWWLFDWLNLESDDELVDIFPGSGAVSVALEGYFGRVHMPQGSLWAP